MSELKVIDLGNIRECIEKGKSVYYEYYAKSEADKVIAEKDKEIADLIEKNKRLANKDMIMASETIKDVFDVLRHHKYKRCLAMARWCDSEMNYWYDRIEMEQCQRFKFYDKWHRRWLELAEKFKEAK